MVSSGQPLCATTNVAVGCALNSLGPMFASYEESERVSLRFGCLNN